MKAKAKKNTHRVIQCEFTTVWDNGTRITTEAKYFPITGEVSAEPSGVDIDANLLDEYITLPNDDRIEVCKVCHEFVKRSEMEEGIGKQLEEVFKCSNPNCESHL